MAVLHLSGLNIRLWNQLGLENNGYGDKSFSSSG
jgi:hypothetical protein